MGAQYRRYFPRSLGGAEAIRRISTNFAQNWFCGPELEEIEAAVEQATEDALFAGAGDVMVLSLDETGDGFVIQIRDRGGQGFMRIFRRLGKVKLAQEA